VTMVAAGAGLRVVNAIFDWPNPTSIPIIVGIWLVLLTTGIVVLALKYRKTHARHV
jgi:hypothetical protein